MKQSKNLMLMILLVALPIIISACASSQKGSQETIGEPSNAIGTESEIQGIVKSVTDNTVTIDLIKISSAEERSAQNPFTLTGESKKVELTEEIPIVTVSRGAEGVSEITTEISNIAKDDLLYIYYKVDGSIEKVRLIQR